MFLYTRRTQRLLFCFILYDFCLLSWYQRFSKATHVCDHVLLFFPIIRLKLMLTKYSNSPLFLVIISLVAALDTRPVTHSNLNGLCPLEPFFFSKLRLLVPSLPIRSSFYLFSTVLCVSWGCSENALHHKTGSDWALYSAFSHPFSWANRWNVHPRAPYRI